MSNIRIDIVENGFIASDGSFEREGKSWVFESAGSLSDFIKFWAECNTKEGDTGAEPWNAGR